MTTATLYAPKVRYTSTFDSQFDAMMTWRAELELAYMVEDDTPDVLAGYAEFLIIRVGEHPIGDLLDSLSEDAAEFAGLFDDDDVSDAVQQQFEDVPFNRVLIVTDVAVAGPVRGHDLGAWLVAEVIDRMASPTDTLVLLRPHSIDSQGDHASEVEAASYWQRVGLVPIEDEPQFLGQTTAYSHLLNGRAGLRGVGDAQVVVPASQICEEKPDVYPRHTVVVESEPQHLRVVRD